MKNLTYWEQEYNKEHPDQFIHELQSDQTLLYFQHYVRWLESKLDKLPVVSSNQFTVGKDFVTPSQGYWSIHWTEYDLHMNTIKTVISNNFPHGGGGSQ